MLICLDTTSLDKVTVKQICDTADINRSTFYAHYPNPIALYKLMEQSMTDSLIRHFTNQKNKSATYIETLHHFLDYCYENRELFLALYKTDSASLKKTLVDLTLSFDFLADTVPENEKAYIFEYYVSGVLSVIARWLRKDRMKNIDEMAQLIYLLTHAPERSQQS